MARKVVVDVSYYMENNTFGGVIKPVEIPLPPTPAPGVLWDHKKPPWERGGKAGGWWGWGAWGGG